MSIEREYSGDELWELQQRDREESAARERERDERRKLANRLRGEFKQWIENDDIGYLFHAILTRAASVDEIMAELGVVLDEVAARGKWGQR